MKKENNKNVMLNLFQHPHRLFSTCGFTLIELLVVVLIIGILAAVAVPQYQIAVAKSKVTKFMPLMKSIEQAEQVYFLANGEYTAYFNKLDVTITEGGVKCQGTAGYNCKDFGTWKCIIAGEESGGITCYEQVSGVGISRKFFSPPNSSFNYWACWAGEEGSLSDKVCKALSQGTSRRSEKGSYRLNNF